MNDFIVFLDRFFETYRLYWSLFSQSVGRRTDLLGNEFTPSNDILFYFKNIVSIYRHGIIIVSYRLLKRVLPNDHLIFEGLFWLKMLDLNCPSVVAAFRSWSANHTSTAICRILTAW